MRFIVSEPSRETLCPTCNKPSDKPYRVYFQGVEDGTLSDRIMQGCVDDFHTGHVTGRDADWHNRPDAVRVREAMARRRGQISDYFAVRSHD